MDAEPLPLPRRSTRLDHRDRPRGLWRARWAAIGAALCVSVGAGGAVRWAGASDGGADGFVAVTPTRILDSRNPSDLGLAGPFVSGVSLDLQVTGQVATADGPATIVPPGATGVVINATAVGPTADGFVSIRPADAAGAITTSNLNVRQGEIVPNAVTVALPTSGPDAGRIEITFDAYGQAGAQVDVIVDVVGYTTELAGLVRHGPVSIGHASWDLRPNAFAAASVSPYATHTVLMGTGSAHLPLEAPTNVDGVRYRLASVEYCVTFVSAPQKIDVVRVTGFRASSVDTPLAVDGTDRTAVGCYRVDVPAHGDDVRAYGLGLSVDGASGALSITAITSTWVPA